MVNGNLTFLNNHKGDVGAGLAFKESRNLQNLTES